MDLLISELLDPNSELFRKPLLVVILGPTGVGKTAVAVSLAQKFSTSVVSADSRQFYKEIPVGTAQPSGEELSAVKHFFIGDRSVSEPVDAGRYAEEAHALLEKEFQKNKIMILCGGSGLYIDAVINGFDPLPDADAVLREELQQLFEQSGIETLQEELKRLDPEFYAEIDQNNPSRLMRAIEVCRLSGKKYSGLRIGGKKSLPFDVLKIGIELPREELYARINQRVDEMMKNGLEEEARSVFEFRNFNALRTVGYKELFDYFNGKTSKEKAVELIKQHSRNYAKRQMTWWRRDSAISWFSPIEIQAMSELILSKG